MSSLLQMKVVPVLNGNDVMAPDPATATSAFQVGGAEGRVSMTCALLQSVHDMVA